MAAGLPLSWFGLIPLDTQQQPNLWLPWHIDGPRALAGAAGWGYLTCTLIAVCAIRSLKRGDRERPATECVLVAIATSGSGAMALSSRLGVQLVCTIVFGAVTVRLLAFDTDGRLLALSYGTTHALDVGLSAMRLPISVRSATLSGRVASSTRARVTMLNLDGPANLVSPSMFNRIPKALRGGLAATSTRLPFTVPVGRSLWVTAAAAVRRCHTATLDTLNLRYTGLGIATGASVHLTEPLTLTCTR
ncbi:MAG: hypothetical protein ACRDKL_06090 [Solirubrobacteraceae bacterium]